MAGQRVEQTSFHDCHARATTTMTEPQGRIFLISTTVLIRVRLTSTGKTAISPIHQKFFLQARKPDRQRMGLLEIRSRIFVGQSSPDSQKSVV